MRKALKYLVRTVLAVVLLLICLAVLLQTSWFRGLIVDYVLAGVNESLQGEIQLGGLGGNLYETIELNDVRLLFRGDTLARARTIVVRYRLAGLFGNQIAVERLEIDSPGVRLEKGPDSVWTISRALSSPFPEPADTAAGEPFAWSILVDTIAVRRLEADVGPAAGRLQVRDGLLRCGFEYRQGDLSLRVDTLALRMTNPDLTVRHCAVHLNKSGSLIRAEDLTILTRRNGITGRAEYDLDNETATASLVSEPVVLEEFLPDEESGLSKRHPVIRSNVVLRNEMLSGDISLTENDMALDLKGRFGIAERDPSYDITGMFRNLDLSELLSSGSDLRIGRGTFSVAGEGFRPGEARLKSSVDLYDGRFGGRELHRLNVELEASGRKLEGSAAVVADAGSVSVQGVVEDYPGARRFRLKGTLNDADLWSLADVKTDIDADFLAEGTLEPAEARSIEVSVRSDSLVIDTVRVGPLRAHARFSAGRLTVDSLLVEGGGIIADVSGTVDTSLAGEGRFLVRIPDLALARFAHPDDSLRGGVEFAGSLSRNAEGMNFSARLNGHQLSVGEVVLGDCGLQIHVLAKPDTAVHITADTLVVSLKHQTWTAAGPVSVRISDDSLVVDPFVLTSDTQQIEGSAALARNQASHAELGLTGIHVGPWLSLFRQGDAEGELDLHLTVDGTRANPDVGCSVSLRGASLDGFKVPETSLDASIRDSLLSWHLQAAFVEGSVRGQGRLPIRLHAGDSLGFIDPVRSLEAHLETDKLKIAGFPLSGKKGLAIAGLVDARLDVSGTSHEPKADGVIMVDSGSVSYPAYGISYRDIRLQLRGDGRNISLEQLNISDVEGKGEVTGHGTLQVGFEDSLRVLPDLTFLARNFDVLSGPLFSATMNGTVGLHDDSEGRILLDGSVTIERSRLSIRDIGGAAGARDPDPPMLLIAAGRIDTSRSARSDSTKRFRFPPFRGKLEIVIPRATWLRGPRLNVELSGRLTVSAVDAATSLEGFLVVEQGTYEFYGRKFVVREGRIDFEGGSEIDPTLFVEVEYEFQTDDTENLLTIVVRGKASNPQITFFHNKVPISESDAISYIVFGRKADDLNYGQRSAVSDLGNALAMDLAANMINAQLSSTLGSVLGLDVVRISGEENWNKAVLTAGKYVTDDIFVSYERGIGQSGSSGVVYESARLEYYLFRFLYLQLLEATDKTSGVDIFFKFE